jgi:MATE family multidrug resistance protein
MFNHTLRETTNLAIVMSMIMAILLALFGDAFINIMTSIPEVVEKSHELLPILVVMPVVSVIAFQMDGVFVGATMGRDMRNAMLVSMIVFLPLMYVMEIWFGLIGIWLAFMILLGLRGATLWMRLNHIRVIIE